MKSYGPVQYMRYATTKTATLSEAPRQLPHPAFYAKFDRAVVLPACALSHAMISVSAHLHLVDRSRCRQSSSRRLSGMMGRIWIGW